MPSRFYSSVVDFPSFSISFLISVPYVRPLTVVVVTFVETLLDCGASGVASPPPRGRHTLRAPLLPLTPLLTPTALHELSSQNTTATKLTLFFYFSRAFLLHSYFLFLSISPSISLAVRNAFPVSSFFPPVLLLRSCRSVSQPLPFSLNLLLQSRGLLVTVLVPVPMILSLALRPVSSSTSHSTSTSSLSFCLF